MADAVAEQIAALKDEDWAIREEAATMLGTLRDPRAVAPLVSVLRDGDRAVRDAAIGALLACRDGDCRSFRVAVPPIVLPCSIHCSDTNGLRMLRLSCVAPWQARAETRA